MEKTIKKYADGVAQKSKDKTAPLPEGLHEKGAGLEGMNASGGKSQGLKQGPNVGQGGRGSSN